MNTTPSQTVGPYYAIGLSSIDADPAGITISGQVFDGNGDPVDDNVIETWQTEPTQLFARSVRDRGWLVRTQKPTATVGQAPHLVVSVFARGLLHRVVTRIYFADEYEANARDTVLSSVPEARRQTLIATPVDGGYRHDIRLQGPDETVFFSI